MKAARVAALVGVAALAGACAVVPTAPDAPVARLDAAPVLFAAHHVRVHGAVDDEAAAALRAQTARVLQASIGGDRDAPYAQTDVHVQAPFTTRAEVVPVRFTTRLPDGRVVVDDARVRRPESPTGSNGGGGCGSPLFCVGGGGGLAPLVLLLPFALFAQAGPVVLIGTIVVGAAIAFAVIGGVTTWAIVDGFDRSARSWGAAYARAVQRHAERVAAVARTRPAVADPVDAPPG